MKRENPQDYRSLVIASTIFIRKINIAGTISPGEVEKKGIPGMYGWVDRQKLR